MVWCAGCLETYLGATLTAGSLCAPRIIAAMMFIDFRLHLYYFRLLCSAGDGAIWGLGLGSNSFINSVRRKRVQWIHPLTSDLIVIYTLEIMFYMLEFLSYVLHRLPALPAGWMYVWALCSERWGKSSNEPASKRFKVFRLVHFDVLIHRHKKYIVYASAGHTFGCRVREPP